MTNAATSHEAEQLVNRTGIRDSQTQEVYEALLKHEGATSAELARYAGVERHVTGRRLPDLERLGLVKKEDRDEAKQLEQVVADLEQVKTEIAENQTKSKRAGQLAPSHPPLAPCRGAPAGDRRTGDVHPRLSRTVGVRSKR